jgi:hypothetical protein
MAARSQFTCDGTEQSCVDVEKLPELPHDFSSVEGFLAKKWGVLMWLIMGTCAAWWDFKARSSEKRDLLRRWINDLTVVLMCSDCRQRFELQLGAHPIEADFQNPQLPSVRIVCGLHNDVNRKLGYPVVGEEGLAKFEEEYLKHALVEKSSSSSAPTMASSSNKEWEVCLWTILYMLCLNFPANFNLQLERHVLLQRVYRRWILATIELIPAEGSRMEALSRDLKSALDAPFLRYTPDTPSTTFRSFLLTYSWNREQLFHWCYDLSCVQRGKAGAPFGTCRQTHNYIERFRYGYKSQTP